MRPQPSSETSWLVRKTLMTETEASNFWYRRFATTNTSVDVASYLKVEKKLLQNM